MKNLKEWLSESDDTQAVVLEYCLFTAMDDNTISEGIEVGDILSKFGLKASKERGLISMLGSTSKHIAALLLAAVKGDKEKIKQLSKQVNRSDFVDFLLKIDQLTMHLLTGPIHMLNAITGWEIEPMTKADVSVIDKVKAATKVLLDKIPKINNIDKKQIDKLLSHVKQITKKLSA